MPAGVIEVRGFSTHSPSFPSTYQTCHILTIHSREEILALCSEETEPEDSPDLGPPPVSRFVTEDPVKIDLPTKSSVAMSSVLSVEESLSKPLPKESSAPVRENEFMPDRMDTVTSQPLPKPTASLPVPEPQVLKVNLKRKIREDDDKENARDVKGGGIVISAKTQPEKQDRPIKNISVKKDVREKATAAAPVLAPRKPLGAKNTNQVVSSPKKPSGKSPILDEIARAKAEVKEAAKAKDRAKSKKKDETPVPVLPPSPEPVRAPMEAVEIEPGVLSPAHELPVPESPEPAVPHEDTRDTPPPADISSGGETSRPSRRARAAVSYAEPNLRDKMRRPTKQLFDAVAGEGKAMRRTSHSRMSDLPSINSEEKSQGGWKDAPKAAPASPLVQKVSRAQASEEKEEEGANNALATVETTKKKRNSSMAAQGAESEVAAPLNRSLGKPTNRRLEEIAQREAEAAKMFDSETDVYEFNCSPTSDSAKNSTATAPPAAEATKKPNGKNGRQVRRLSSIIREDLGLSETCTQEKPAKGNRKRASMTAAQKTAPSLRLDAEDSATDADSSFNSTSSGDTEPSNRDRVTMRRRSMML
jgi:hypothetical protein